MERETVLLVKEIQKVFWPPPGAGGDRDLCSQVQRFYLPESPRLWWGAAGPQGEITAMAKLCQETVKPPASKDDEDLANEHISSHPCGQETRGLHLNALGEHSQKLGGRGCSRKV